MLTSGTVNLINFHYWKDKGWTKKPIDESIGFFSVWRQQVGLNDAVFNNRHDPIVNILAGKFVVQIVNQI